jgi:hypothetical protein
LSPGKVMNLGRAVAQRLRAGFPPPRPGFAYWQHVGFVVDKAALGQVFSEYFGFTANHSTDFSIIIITRGLHNRPLSGRSVEWTLVPPPTMQIKKKVMNFLFSTSSRPALESTQPPIQYVSGNLSWGKVAGA